MTLKPDNWCATPKAPAEETPLSVTGNCLQSSGEEDDFVSVDLVEEIPSEERDCAIIIRMRGAEK